MKIYTFDLASKRIGTLASASDIVYSSVVFSSKLYPIDVHEGVGAALGVTGVRMLRSPTPLDSVSAGMSLNGSTMRVALQTGYSSEQVSTSMVVSASTLRALLHTAYADQDAVSSSASLLSSSLLTKLVTITNAEHSISSSASITSGTLA